MMKKHYKSHSFVHLRRSESESLDLWISLPYVIICKFFRVLYV